MTTPAPATDPAESQLRQVVTILEKTLGPIHPNLAIAVENLSAVCQATGKTAEAQKLRARAAAINAAHAAANPTG